MRRKYLDDIGATDRPDTYGEDDERQEKWKKQQEEYGFDERETWNLDITFRLWLYERLKCYLDIAPIDLEYHTFDYNGKKYTQKQMIDMMLERLEFSFKPEYDDWGKDFDYVHEIEKIWALVMPAMWW